jgi:hypothetical protein
MKGTMTRKHARLRQMDRKMQLASRVAKKEYNSFGTLKMKICAYFLSMKGMRISPQTCNSH